MNTETVIFGRKTDQPEWAEVLLVSEWDRVKNKDAVLDAIKRDGWIIRIATIGLSKPPDFRKAIRGMSK